VDDNKRVTERARRARDTGEGGQRVDHRHSIRLLYHDGGKKEFSESREAYQIQVAVSSNRLDSFDLPPGVEIVVAVHRVLRQRESHDGRVHRQPSRAVEGRKAKCCQGRE